MAAPGPSKTVAILGATGGFGRAVAEEFAKSGKFELVFFLRKIDHDLVSSLTSLQPSSSQPFYFHVIHDFTSIPSLLPHFQRHQIDTIISCLSSYATTGLLPSNSQPTTSSSVEAEKVLVKTGLQAGTLKRFVPSGWAIPFKRGKNQPRLFDDKIYMQEWLLTGGNGNETLEMETKIKDLDWTFFSPGVLMNYLGSFAPPKKRPSNNSVELPQENLKTGEETATMGLRKTDIVVSPSQLWMDVVGTGDEQIIFTELRDVGKYAVGACCLKMSWGKGGEGGIGEMIGDKISFNEIMGIIERIRERPLKTTYTPLPEALTKLSSILTQGPLPPPPLETFDFECSILMAQGRFGDWENNLGRVLAEENLVVDFLPTKVEGFLEHWWSDVQHVALSIEFNHPTSFQPPQCSKDIFSNASSLPLFLRLLSALPLARFVP